jgi:hypothetical protein
VYDLTQIVAGKGESQRAVQEYLPLSESLEWRLGQRYLRGRGSSAFLSDARPVPYVVNNDGSLSKRSAELLFANIRAADESGALDGSILCLELGVGVGLFARYLLDAFRGLCQEEGKDYYDRLCYIAADRSERMLRDACRQGIFAAHPGRYLLRVADAGDLGRGLAAELGRMGCGPRALRAVFLNYLLDCLPAAVLDVAGDECRQLCVRTCLARGVRLEQHTDVTLEQLRRLATSTDPRAEDELLQIYPLLASEYDFQTVETATIPYSDFAIDFARKNSSRVLHSYGAIQSLDRLLDLLAEDGFILINDYGPTQVTPGEEYEHQQFSLATFIGVNFPLLRTYFGNRLGRCWAEPAEEGDNIHARLLGHQPPEDTVRRFRESFSKARSERLHEPVERARGGYRRDGWIQQRGHTAKRWSASQTTGSWQTKLRTF